MRGRIGIRHRLFHMKWVRVVHLHPAVLFYRRHHQRSHVKHHRLHFVGQRMKELRRRHPHLCHRLQRLREEVDWDALVRAGLPKPGPPTRLESAVPERQAQNVQADGSGQIAKRLIEKTRDRSLSRGRSRERRPPAKEHKRDWSRSRSTAPWQDKGRPDTLDGRPRGPQQGWQENPKRKRSEPARASSGSGLQQPKKPVDNIELSSDKTKTFHENLVAAAREESVRNGTWKNDVSSVHGIREVVNNAALGGMVQHVKEIHKDKKRTSNKRIYTGPGRDGSTDDKISVDLKFDPSNTKVTCLPTWKQQGYKKTSFMLDDRSVGGKTWVVIEDSVPLDEVKDFSAQQPEQVAILLHPAIQTKKEEVDDNREWAGGGTDRGSGSSSTTVPKVPVFVGTPGNPRVLKSRTGRALPKTDRIAAARKAIITTSPNSSSSIKMPIKHRMTTMHQITVMTTPLTTSCERMSITMSSTPSTVA